MKKLSSISRNLHRDLGYFVIGITIIYAFTGLCLSFRDIHLFQTTYTLELKIPPKLQTPSQIKAQINQIVAKNKFPTLPKFIQKVLPIDSIKEIKSSNEAIEYQISKKKYARFAMYFPASGKLVYTLTDFPTWLNVLVSAHKSSSKDAWAYLALAYSFILLILSISAFFMLSGKYGFRQRGVYLFGAGLLVVALFLWL